MPTALAISPHLDDAAFSCGGSLSALAAGGWRVVVATVFTASVPDPQGFALACQLDKGLAPDVDYMALRRAEDREAVEALGAEPVWLDFREAPHRGYESVASLFDRPQADDLVADGIAAALRTLNDDVRPDLILAPQAIGGHVDHVQVVRAVDEVAARQPIIWWRDFPYVVRDSDPPMPFGARMGALTDLELRLDERAREAKRDACHAYATQIGFQFGGADALDRTLDEAGPAEHARGSAPLSERLDGIAEHLS